MNSSVASDDFALNLASVFSSSCTIGRLFLNRPNLGIISQQLAIKFGDRYSLL